MPFRAVLAKLVGENRSACGALLVDDTGEAVDVAAGEMSATDLRVLGAYLGIHVRSLRAAMPAEQWGRLDLLHVQHQGAHIYAAALEDGYMLALVQRPPAFAEAAKRSLQRARDVLNRELFANG